MSVNHLQKCIRHPLPGICLIFLLASALLYGQDSLLETGIRDAALRLEKPLVQGSVVAVLDCAAPSENLTAFVSQEIAQCFVKSGKLVVVDRKDIEVIKKELTFQLSGEVSDESAQSIGKMLGAQIIITGTLDDTRLLRLKAIAVETARILAMESVRLPEGTLYNTLRSGSKTGSIVDVSTADELIAAVGSDKTIRLKKGIYDISQSWKVKNRVINWVDEYDGLCPVIRGVSNLAIIGEEGAEIVIEPAYGWVFSFENCSAITLSGITFGHSVPGHCLGGVLRFKNCEQIDMSHCDLYGSGTIGISLERTQKFAMSDSIIRECTYGLLRIERSTDISFINTQLRDTGEYSLIEVIASENVLWQDCTFSNNRGSALFSIDSLSANILAESCLFSRNTTEEFAQGRSPGLRMPQFSDNSFASPR